MNARHRILPAVLSLIASAYGTAAVAADARGNAASGFVPLKIIDVNATPWDAASSPRLKTKTFFRNENHGRLVYYLFTPTWDTKIYATGSKENPMRTHYHGYHEWAYHFSGDYVIHEPSTPFQKNAPLFRYPEGTWLSRPAFSLHSGDWHTGGLRSQNPATMIIMEEGEFTTQLLPDRQLQSRSSKTRQSTTTSLSAEEWTGKSYTHPYVIFTGSEMEWDDDDEVKGRLVKWLQDDPEQGFRAQLIKVPPGWVPPAEVKQTYFENANRLRYMLYGDLRVVPYDTAGKPGEVVTLKKDVIVHQVPRSVWGFSEGSVSESGAVWLEVTYAKGMSLSKGPIEAAKVLR